MAEEIKDGVEQKEETTQEETREEKKETVDVERERTNAVNGFLEGLGVESEETLKEIIKKHTEAENANKTELERVQTQLTETTKKLVKETKARELAEAKLQAVTMGAKPDLVNDLVVVAMSKVTKEKNIEAVVAEMKEQKSFYFVAEEEKEEGKGKAGSVTRKPVEKTGEEKKETKGTGTLAERLFNSQNKASGKSSYFGGGK